jgi:MYXO-CTERM domain-containing protein
LEREEGLAGVPLLCLLPAFRTSSAEDSRAEEIDPPLLPSSATSPLPPPPMEDIVGLAAVAAALHHRRRRHRRYTRCVYRLPYEYRKFEFDLES